MYVIVLTYTAPLEALDAAMAAHRAFLDRQYAAGVFIASGPQIPRTGGVIIARGLDRAALERVPREDVFHQQGLATYQLIEFQARGVAPALAAFAEP